MKVVSCVMLLFVVFCLASFCIAADQAALQPGQASGTLNAEGKTVTLSHAAVYVDTSEKPPLTVLILSDQVLPVSTWKSSSDQMMYRMDHKFGGVAFSLNDKREVLRTEFFTDSFPTSAAGIFELKLDQTTGKNFKGTATSNAAAASLTDPVKLEAKFNAELK